MKKHLILFLAANPGSTSRLALDEECAAIERELRMTAHRDDFEFRSKWAVTVDEMMRHLVELKPTIIHFSGYGAGTTAGCSSAMTRDVGLPGDSAAVSCGIYLQGDQGGSQLVTARALTMMIKSAAASTRVVVLNACYSELQADALRSVVDCVVGMTGAIEDAAARSFAAGFYRALGNRCSIGNAVDQAVAALAAKQMTDEVLPRCRTRNGIDAHHVLLGPVVATAAALPASASHPQEQEAGQLVYPSQESDPLLQEVTPRTGGMLGRADRLFRQEARSDGLLLVEDDEILGGALLAHLDSRYAVVLARDVAEALRLVQRCGRSLQVALIDLSLPDGAGPNVPMKGGSELAAYIWQTWPHIRIIGTSQFATAKRARAVGAWFSAYIEKRDLLTDGAPSKRFLKLLQKLQRDASTIQA